ncbi:hypothetical protein [Candidatus Tisiphia endosymbiont of Metellina segmentata]|uniref:hypothetical protein n=1 Tax=Candidatus Tisiphia endosymbiont of Metellina segmentata TaxID=3066274 RepID=UPI00313F0C6F
MDDILSRKLLKTINEIIMTNNYIFTPRMNLVFKEIFDVKEENNKLLGFLDVIVSKAQEDRVIDVSLKNFLNDKLSILTTGKDGKDKGSHTGILMKELNVLDAKHFTPEESKQYENYLYERYQVQKNTKLFVQHAGGPLVEE